MIRDIFVIAIILISVILGHVYVQNLLKENSVEVISKLEEIKSKIQNDETEDLKEKAQKVYDYWKEQADIWSIIVDHQEIDNIEKSVLNIKASIESEDRDQIMSKIDESIFLISLIEDKEKLSIKNVF